MTFVPTPTPSDPVEGTPGHFDHTNWVKQSILVLDSALSSQASSITGKINRSGDGMTGRLTGTEFEAPVIDARGTDPKIVLYHAGVGEVALTVNAAAEVSVITAQANESLGRIKIASPTLSDHGANKSYVDTQDAKKLNLTGGTLTGNITVSKTGNYGPRLSVVDDALNGASLTLYNGVPSLNVTTGGGGISGTLARLRVANPVNSDDAANKFYVDEHVGGSVLGWAQAVAFDGTNNGIYVPFPTQFKVGTVPGVVSNVAGGTSNANWYSSVRAVTHAGFIVCAFYTAGTPVNGAATMSFVAIGQRA